MGVFAESNVVGSTAVLVSTLSGKIYGDGLGLSSTGFYLGTGQATVLLQSDGSNWQIISGRQDTGWQSLGLGTHITSLGGSSYTPSVRIAGDLAYLSGAAVVGSGGYTGNATMFEIPSPSDAGAPSYAPARNVVVSASYGVGSNPAWSSGSAYQLQLQVSTGGTISYANSLSPGVGGEELFLDGAMYRLLV